MGLWLYLYEFVLMTSLMKSSGHKIYQSFELPYLRQYLIYSIDRILKMSKMVMAILLTYSTSGITYGKKMYADLKMVTFLKMSKF